MDPTTAGELKPQIVWIDIECSGLAPLDDHILEIGARVTDWWGTEIDRFTSLVYTPFWMGRIIQNEFVFDMHTKSGLIDDLRELEHGGQTANEARAAAYKKFSIDAVEARMLEWLKPYTGNGPHGGKFPMSGNSVHFDRSFFAVDAPNLERWFHYRNHDISALREACRLANSELHASEPEVPKPHRVQGDIDNSITLWRHYLQNFLWVSDTLPLPSA